MVCDRLMATRCMQLRVTFYALLLSRKNALKKTRGITTSRKRRKKYMHHETLHKRALEIVSRYFKAEADLVEILQEIGRLKSFRRFGYTSLFDYAVKALKLSESAAYNFISVARKADEVPALKQEIKSGELSVSKAKKIVSVLTPENQSHWINQAKTLPKLKLEKEVAKVNPKESRPDRASYLSETMVALSGTVSEKTYQRLKRIQDLVSQSKQKAATLDDALDVVFEEYLERHDPVRKAERIAMKSRLTQEGSSSDASSGTDLDSRSDSSYKGQLVPGPVKQRNHPETREKLPSHLIHKIELRDQSQCTKHTDGVRCTQRRWLHYHHIVPKHRGGPDTLENLTTLCSAHHKMEHTAKVPKS
jgi:hypothetical protein